MLDMWANICKCVYGHTKAEKQQRQKEALEHQVKRCLRQQHQIPVAYHKTFRRSPYMLCDKASVHYLEVWIVAFDAIRMQAGRNYCDWVNVRKQNEGSDT